MRILGLDTATRATTVALLDTDSDPTNPRAAVERRDDPPAGERPRHTTQLLSLIVSVLSASETEWGEVDLLAVGIGPGTFTGLRVGVATARALAQARGLPIVGVSTLQSLALGAAAPAASGGRSPLALLDARRGEVFAAGWSVRDGDRLDAEPLLAPHAASPETLAVRLRDRPERWLAVGDGSIEFRAALELSGAVIPDDGSQLHRVSATNHCRLATGLEPQTPDHVQPAYLRLPDAELSLRARAGDADIR